MSLLGDYFRATIKLIGFSILIATYFVICLLLYPFYVIFPERLRPFLIKVVSFYCRFGLVLFGVEVEIDPCFKKDKNYLIVANHLSYLDVIILGAFYPSSFVTSVEIQKTFFLGQICQLGGCLFVERRSRKHLSKEVAQLTAALKSGINVCVFPEGTSTNGESVLRFRRPLFQAAIDSGVAVLPIAISYQAIEGIRVNTHNRDQLFWYGDMTFFSHFWSFLKMSQVEVNLVETSPLLVDQTDISGVDDLAQNAHLSVSQHYQAPIHGRESDYSISYTY